MTSDEFSIYIDHGDEASHGFIIGDDFGLIIQSGDVAIATPPGLELALISTACLFRRMDCLPRS
jgi:hypothetical protein